ncbi:MAG: quinoprotein dehydrogenase-associated SoxYZ-like carrier [Hyphomicrobium sp.]|nr:quinoprotein dehydrogenase-associated SoxYZ-like carrier [Hyphomicrobium sp.]
MSNTTNEMSRLSTQKSSGNNNTLCRSFTMQRRTLKSALISIAILAATPQNGYSADPAAELWSALKQDVFGAKAIREDSKVVVLEAPSRAEDAAYVPIRIKIAGDRAASVKSVTLLIDTNPSPLAAVFRYGPAAGGDKAERVIETRVRMDSYSNVRAVAETTDGQLHMATAFVKASGGCSAPSPKDSDAGSKDFGKVVVRHLNGDKAGLAQVMIRHPNNNGLQMDPISRNFIPANFIQAISIRRNGDTFMDIESGISISSDPNYRFSFSPDWSHDIKVVARGLDETLFEGQSTDSATQ